MLKGMFFYEPKYLDSSVVFKHLFYGGRILIEHTRTKRCFYSVIRWSDIYGRNDTVGRITRKQFFALKSILKCVKSISDELICQYTLYELDWDEAQRYKFPDGALFLPEEVKK